MHIYSNSSLKVFVSNSNTWYLIKGAATMMSWLRILKVFTNRKIIWWWFNHILAWVRALFEMSNVMCCWKWPICQTHFDMLEKYWKKPKKCQMEGWKDILWNMNFLICVILSSLHRDQNWNENKNSGFLGHPHVHPTYAESLKINFATW